MRRFLFLLLFLLPGSAWAQQPPPPPAAATVLGGELSADELKALEDRYREDSEALSRAKNAAKTVKLKKGGYSVYYPNVTPGKAIKLPVLWLTSTAGVVTKIDVPAGQVFTGYLLKDGDAEPSLVTLPAQTFPWWILVGKKVGTTTIAIVANGRDDKTAPALVAQLEVTVGEPAPPAPPVPPAPAPSNDALVLAARADVAAGKGTADDVAFLREYFRTAGNSLSGTIQYQTVGEFYHALTVGAVSKLGEAPTGKLPGLRRAIANQLDTDIPYKTGDPFDAGARGKIAAALLNVAKRLEGAN